MFDVRRAAQWVVGIAAGVAWAARRLVRTELFYDEWTLVAQAVHRSPWEAAWASFNGHLWLLQDAVYRSQFALGGVDVRWPVVLLQLASLAGLHAAITRLALRSGVPLAVSLVSGLAVVYMGTAPQNWVFVVQWAGVASLALASTACAVVVGGPPGRGRSVVTALLLVGAVLVESGAGTVGLAMVAGVALVRWRRSGGVLLLPASALLSAWYLLADLGPDFPSSLRQRAGFAVGLLVRSAGGLVGAGPSVGAVLCGALAVGAVWGLRRGGVSVLGRALLAGGVLGAAVAVAAISVSRAGLPGFDFADSNRYLFPVAVPLAVATLPVVAAVIGSIGEPRGGLVQRKWLWGAVGIALLAGFAVGQRFEARWSPDFLAANTAVRSGVASTALVLRDGCPGGGSPDPDALPVGRLSPQVTVRLVAELMERGLLRAEADSPVDASVSAAICP